MKNVFRLSIFVIPLFFIIINCKVDVTGDVDLTHDTAKNGMIQGKVSEPKIGTNNEIVNVGTSGATITLEGTQYSTTSVQGGLYSIDDVPTGSYTVYARLGMNNTDDRKSVTVRRQETSTVPELILNPTMYSQYQLFYGTIYEADKITPFSNQEVSLYSAGVSSSGQVTISGSSDATTTTSNTGKYAFYSSGHYKVLWNRDYNIIFMSPESQHSGSSDLSGMHPRNAYATPK